MANEITLCLCGRDVRRPHCPHCGSAAVLASARKRDYVTRQDGSTAELIVSRCRVCAGVFNSDDVMLRCNAPAPQYGRPKNPNPQPPIPAARVVADRVANALAQPNALELALEKIKKNRGL